MRVRATAATAALFLAALTACGGGGDDKTASAEAAPSAVESADCTSQTLSQAEYMEHCAEETPEAESEKLTGLKFGESYTWDDGLKVTVVEAKKFTDYDPELLESPEPGMTDFRVGLKVENGGKAPVALDDLSLIVEGATKGGEAASTIFSKGSEPLEGRLAPGVTVLKNHDNTLETGYGKKIVVTVQRITEDFDIEYPEFEGEITG